MKPRSALRGINLEWFRLMRAQRPAERLAMPGFSFPAPVRARRNGNPAPPAGRLHEFRAAGSKRHWSFQLEECFHGSFPAFGASAWPGIVVMVVVGKGGGGASPARPAVGAGGRRGRHRDRASAGRPRPGLGTKLADLVTSQEAYKAWAGSAGFQNFVQVVRAVEMQLGTEWKPALTSSWREASRPRSCPAEGAC